MAESPSVLREETEEEEVVHSLKIGRPLGVDNIPSELLGDERMAEGVDTIACHTFIKERQLQVMSGLSYDQTNQPLQQDHDPSYPQLIYAQG